MSRFSNSGSASVGTALADVLTVPVGGQLLDGTITLTNTGTTTTTSFAIVRQITPGGPWLTWASGSDFNGSTSAFSPSNNPPPNAVPAAGSAFCDFKPGPCEAVKFQVSGGTTVTASFSGRTAP